MDKELKTGDILGKGYGYTKKLLAIYAPPGSNATELHIVSEGMIIPPREPLLPKEVNGKPVVYSRVDDYMKPKL